MSNRIKRVHGRDLAAQRRAMGARLFRAAAEAAQNGNAASSRNKAREFVRGVKNRSRTVAIERAAALVEEVQAVVCVTRREKRMRGHGWRPFQPRKTAERWAIHHRATMRRELRNALDFFPSFGDLYVELNDGNAITARTEVGDLGKYSSRCTFRKIEHDGYISVPRHGVRVDTSDGVVMVLRYRQAQRVGTVTATPGAIVSRRGYDLSAREAWLVRDDATGMTAHGATRHAAMRALSAKRAAETRRHSPLTMDTILTPAAYQRITGACTEGTNNWLAAHNLTRSSRATVREVLAMLSADDYGRDKLARAVGA